MKGSDVLKNRPGRQLVRAACAECSRQPREEAARGRRCDAHCYPCAVCKPKVRSERIAGGNIVLLTGHLE